jgi:hypothetical protein
MPVPASPRRVKSHHLFPAINLTCPPGLLYFDALVNTLLIAIQSKSLSTWVLDKFLGIKIFSSLPLRATQLNVSIRNSANYISWWLILILPASMLLIFFQFIFCVPKCFVIWYWSVGDGSFTWFNNSKWLIFLINNGGIRKIRSILTGVQ